MTKREKQKKEILKQIFILSDEWAALDKYDDEDSLYED